MGDCAWGGLLYWGVDEFESLVEEPAEHPARVPIFPLLLPGIYFADDPAPDFPEDGIGSGPCTLGEHIQERETLLAEPIVLETIDHEGQIVDGPSCELFADGVLLQEEVHDGGLAELPALFIEPHEQLLGEGLRVLQDDMEQHPAVLIGSVVPAQLGIHIGQEVVYLSLGEVVAVELHDRQVLEDVQQQLLLVPEVVVGG